jgi:hypothetical protein
MSNNLISQKSAAIFLLFLVVKAKNHILGVKSLCTSDFDCSLNGICDVSSGLCACDKPWIGQFCDKLSYKISPATGKDVWNPTGIDPRNTWNGPILRDPKDGLYHLFDPVYQVGSLLDVTSFAHGVATEVTGPYDFSLPNVTAVISANPAALVFPNETTGEPVYSLWVGGKLLVSSSPSSPFETLDGVTYPGGDNNPAPTYYNGAFYLTNQPTTQVFTSTSITGPWNVWAEIPQSYLPSGYTVEDPFLFFDKRGNAHIVNHAYSTDQYFNCSSSYVSSHFFSTDGKNWGWSDEPYSHLVLFDDGTWHAYSTLERPNLHFDVTGQLTHIGFAADLVTSDVGCYNRTGQPGPTPDHTSCVNCKYADHAGTLIVALDV